MISGVRGEDDRDAEPRLFGEFLRPVRPRGQFAGREVIAEDQVSDVALVEVVVQGAGIERRDLHQPGLLLQGHPGKQVRHTLLNRQSPILVGVEHAVAVQILEGEIADLQQGGDPGVDLRLFWRAARRL